MSKDREERLADELEDRIRRRQRAQRRRPANPLRGLGVFGVVGWSVAVPTLAGLALGLWLDDVADTQRSWTITLLLAGVAFGCFNAWYWIAEMNHVERDLDHDEQEDEP